jgi:hypothetical protein
MSADGIGEAGILRAIFVARCAEWSHGVRRCHPITVPEPLPDLRALADLAQDAAG